MSFTFPLLLGGLLVAGVPVLLHFLMRHKPRMLAFPAFRFLVQRHRSNVTRLRLRHFLLLLLRVGLIALICLALAQPRVKDNPWSLPTDQPVAAVFVFDTSASMEYTVMANQTRLKEAQKRALELLKFLPEGSEVAILDTARPPPDGQTDWQTRKDAAERIGNLKTEAANAPVTVRVENALKILGRLATPGDKDERSKRPRLLAVFSDRTLVSWPAKATRNLQALVDAVPPTFERLGALQGELPGLMKLVLDAPQRLPLTSPYATGDLGDRIDKLRSQLGEVRADDYPDSATTTQISTLRPRLRELAAALPADDDKLAPEAREFRGKLHVALRSVLRSSAGFTALYLDVGIDQPVDLALSDLQLIREDPRNRDPGVRLKDQLATEIEATGQAFQPTIVIHTGAKSEERAWEARPGERKPVLFDLPAEMLRPGHYQAKVLAKPNDNLPVNNSRYLTYAVRPILLLTDGGPEQLAAVERWGAAIEAQRFGAALFRCDTKTAQAFAETGSPENYQAIFLCNVKQPTDALWVLLKEYVKNGGGLGILPGDVNKAAYNDNKDAREIMPAKLDDLVTSILPGGVEWDWSEANYQHPLMHPYQEWRQGNFDIGRVTRGAFKYWAVSGLAGKSSVLVPYQDDKKRPALVQRIVDFKRGRPGRVLLLTTPPAWPGNWNNYDPTQHSFFLALAGRAVGELTGDADRQALNFLCNRLGPRVPVPVRGQVQTYNLYRDAALGGSGKLAIVTVEAGHNESQMSAATEAGNYVLKLDDGTPVGWFSVNLPAEESDLTRVSKEAIEAVLGPDAVLTMDTRADLRGAMEGYISKPLELLPYLMLGLLLLLAVENLLANKFYRRE